MKYLYSGLCLLVSAFAATADDAPTPNTLTPDEAAAGWMLLFDGINADGLRLIGQASMPNGEFVLGGTVGSRVGPAHPLPGNFELRLDYRMTGTAASQLIIEQKGFMSSGMSSQPLYRSTQDSDGWHELWITCTVDPDTGLKRLSRKTSTPGRVQESVSTMQFEEGMALAFCFEVMPGNQLFLRNIKLKADPPDPTALYGLYGLSGGLLVLLVVGVVIWRWRRRVAAEEG